jgi:branched-chain amino acid transport system permease protein
VHTSTICTRALWQPFAFLALVQKVVQNGQTIVHFAVSFWIMLPLSGVIAAFFGAPTLRLRGDYLAFATLGFGEIFPIVARNWTGLTNGAAGLNGIAGPTIFYRLGHRFDALLLRRATAGRLS